MTFRSVVLGLLLAAAISAVSYFNDAVINQSSMVGSYMPTALLAGFLVCRVAMGSLSVYFYLRGGVLLAWWWGLLLQSRHLWTLP